MKWPRALGAFAAALLPLPWVFFFFSTQWGVSPGQESWRISPVLTLDVRRQLVTYQRQCQSGADCEAPMGCVAHWRLKKPICSDSECTTDLDCEQGDSCQVMKTVGQGPSVRVCVTQGWRKEGQQCTALPFNREDACAPGLRCLAGWCGRPCREEEFASCPEGFFCAEDPVISACLPTCATRGCPEGQQCVQLGTVASQPVSVCVAVVHGTNCQQSPCPDGQRCFHQEVPERPGEVWMSCVQSCGNGKPTCPEGLACDTSFCRKLCDPQEAGACGPGMLCARRAPDLPWMCRPDYWTQINGGTPR